MYKKMLILAVLMMVTNVLLGGEDVKSAWQKSIIGGINITQTGFDNWSSGGENAFSWQLHLSYQMLRDYASLKWENSGKFSYGATKNGSKDMQKSIDEIKAESVLTYKMGSSVNPFLAVTGETQFAEGFNYNITPAVSVSAFMDPAYFRESMGFGMVIHEGIGTRLGLSFKQTITSMYPAPYADDPATIDIEKIKSEFGAESVTDISLSLSETSSLTSKLELFSAVSSLDEIDVNFDNMLLVKITEYVNMNINMKLVYDKDISVKRQIKESMAIGLNYTFI